jgi:serine phosphatase RsbU (regulator of sigma subunit)
VAEERRAPLDLRTLLAAVEAASPVEAVDVLAGQLAEMLGATSVSLLVTNFTGDALVRMSHVRAAGAVLDGHNERAESVPLSGSSQGQVLASQQLIVSPGVAAWDVLVPITERGDAIGVLELSLPNCPVDEELTYLESAAHALAYVLVAARRHTDLYEWAQRDTPFSLAAEIQRRLLPAAYTVEAGPVTLAGWLEPAANVGGDTFDYSLDREFLYVSVTDAMGHSIEAAMLATLTVAALRNARRGLATAAEQADRANSALKESVRPDQFVTGLIGRIRLEDGRAEFVNAGHPAAFLLRAGEVTNIFTDPDPMLGVHEGAYRLGLFQLEPGDRVLLVTDGFLERNAAGIQLPGVLQASADRHPREVVRELASRVLDATGRSLRDDATVVCLDWHGPGATREAMSGASRGRATQPRPDPPLEFAALGGLEPMVEATQQVEEV